MSDALEAKLGQAWKKPPFISNPWLRWGLLIGALIYLSIGLTDIDVNWSRIVNRGLQRGWAFIVAFGGIFDAFFNMAYSYINPDALAADAAMERWSNIGAGKGISKGIYESIVMAIASTVTGILVSVPIALGAARNMAILPVYLICRAIIATSRSLNEIIVAIFLVAMFGFGPLAGYLTLSFATIGFFAKLMAEEIEDINKVPAEAIKATGSTWLQWVNFGIQPQIIPRFIGLSIYRLDINFRESAILGLVGAGGIGGTLEVAFSRYEFETVAAILLIIITIVMALEYISGVIRTRVQ